MKLSGLILLVVLVLVMIVPTAAFAADSQLEIESTHAYTGMEKPYSEGYVPSVAGGFAYIRLPLKQTGAVVGDKITVSIDLGEPSTSPFVYKNYDTEVLYQDYFLKDETTKNPCYLIAYSLELAAGRVNGRYPITIKTSFINSLNERVEQSFTIYVTIADGIDPNPAPTPTPTPEPTPAPEQPVSQPKIIVSKYAVDPQIVLAGTEFSVNITLKNTSTKQNVQNIVVTYRGETSDLMPVSNSNTFYVSKLGKGAEETFAFKMNVRTDVKPAPQKILLQIAYEDEKAQPLSASDEILVQLKQPVRLKFDAPTIPPQVFAGDSMSAGLNIYNLGKNTLYNVMVTLEAEGFVPEGGSYLGNMESGATKSAEIYAFIEDMQGPKQGKFVVTYEDEYGQVYAEDVIFETEILPMQIPEEYPPEMPPEEMPRTGMPVWVWVIIIAGAAAAVAVVLRIRKKKKQALEDEEDYDAD